MKNTAMKRTLTALILASMLCSLAACGGKTPSGDDTKPSGTSSDETNTSAEDTANPLDDDLGEYDFNGETFTIDTRAMNSNSWLTSVIDVQEESADILLSSIFKRNRKIEQRFNCVIKESNSESRNEVARRADTVRRRGI